MRGTPTVALVAILLAAAASDCSGGKRTGATNRCTAAPAFKPGRLGAVAYLRGHRLQLVDLSTGKDHALTTVQPQAQNPYPALEWSPDGRWISVCNTLVAAADGATCRPFRTATFNVGWRPHSPSLIASTRSGRVLIAKPGQAPRPLLPRAFSTNGSSAFDPSGRRIVAEGPKASLSVFDLATGKRTRIWRSPAPFGRIGPPSGERWSPDGRWILFQTDTDHSASIAADGLPLWAIPARGGHPIQIEQELLGADDFLRPCGNASDRIVISAGFDRYVSAHKRLDLAGPPSWKPRTISNDPRHSWYAAACSPDGSLVAATVTANREEGRFDTAERSIWLLASDGSRRRLLVGKSKDGISDEQPRWSREGSWILFLQHPARPFPRAALYLISIKTGQRRGPYAQINGGLGYYGYHDWDGAAAWYQPSSSVRAVRAAAAGSAGVAKNPVVAHLDGVPVRAPTVGAAWGVCPAHALRLKAAGLVAAKRAAMLALPTVAREVRPPLNLRGARADVVRHTRRNGDVLPRRHSCRGTPFLRSALVHVVLPAERAAPDLRGNLTLYVAPTPNEWVIWDEV